MKRFFAVLVAVLFITSVASAQSADEFIKQARQSYSLKQYAQSATFYEKAFAAGSTDALAAYDAACCTPVSAAGTRPSSC